MSHLHISKRIVTWTKESRGGEAAGRRTAACRVSEPTFTAPLPGGATDFLFHTTLAEANGFRPLESVEAIEWPGGNQLFIRPLRFTKRVGTLMVVIENDYMALGAPRRCWGRIDLFAQQPGEVGQIEYNGRFSSKTCFHHTSGWHYQQVRFRIHWSESPKPDWQRLAHCPPNHSFKDMHDLW